MSSCRSPRLLAAALAAALTLPCLALASPEESLQEADRNGDSRLDRSEFHQRMVDVFYQLDTDRSGSLTAAELRLDPEAVRAADSNGDGSISLDEYVNDRFKDFRSADRNGDGVLGIDEVKSR